MYIPNVKKWINTLQIVDGNVKLAMKIPQFYESLQILIGNKFYYKYRNELHMCWAM